MVNYEKLDKALAVMASTDEGRRVLNFIHELSGFSSELYDRTNPNHNTYNLGKRDLWLDIRRRLTQEQISQIEHLPGE